MCVKENSCELVESSILGALMEIHFNFPSCEKRKSRIRATATGKKVCCRVFSSYGILLILILVRAEVEFSTSKVENVSL